MSPVCNLLLKNISASFHCVSAFGNFMLGFNSGDSLQGRSSIISIIISFCSESLLVETILPFKTLITLHDLWWDFKARKPLHRLPQQHLTLSTLPDFLLFKLIIGTMVLLPSRQSFVTELFPTLTLALYLQTCLPSNIKSTLQNDHTVKIRLNHELVLDKSL